MVKRAIVVLLLSSLASAQQPVTLDYPTLLDRLVNHDWLWRPPAVGERCVQFSSYDRNSDKGPGDAAAWYANDDRGKYLRVDERDGQKEFVMAECDGPGCIARIWSANPSGKLLFDIDGERVWSVDFAQLCNGKVDGVPSPIAAMTSRGGSCYLPMPFAKHLRVAATAGDLYYHVDVVRFDPAAVAPSFDGNVLVAHRDAIAHVASELGSAGFGDGWGSQWALPATIPAGDVLHGLKMSVQAKDKKVDVAAVLRRTRLRVACGDEQLVDVPVTDFFGGGPEWRAFRGRMLGVGEDGSAYCCFPMPFPRRGSIDLVTDGGRDGVDLQLNLTVGPQPLGSDPLLFHASYHLAKATPTRPFADHLVLDAKGKGRFVGCSLLVRNPSRAWWGEGDEKFWVDGEKFPSWFGTGTEDYFGYAWCDPTPFSAPFHAQVQCDGPGNYGFTELQRTHVLDSVPFQQSFRFELERWHWVEDIKVDYATVAYWYGAPGATSGLPAVPPAAERVLEKLAPPPVFVAKDAIEGEGLRVLRCSGGTNEVQDLSFCPNTFSHDAHRWWRDGKVGDAMVLVLPVATAGRYRVTVAMTRADDFGIVQLSLAGQKLGAPFDGYADHVSTSGPFVGGEITLAAGDNELRFELVGQNDKAKPRRMVGFDYVQLEKME